VLVPGPLGGGIIKDVPGSTVGNGFDAGGAGGSGTVAGGAGG
jgi:hypothetical protein